MRRPDAQETNRVYRRYRRRYTDATEHEVLAGRLWYLRARCECASIGARYGYPIINVVLAVAALSPQVAWRHNLALADALASDPNRNPGHFGHIFQDARAALLHCHAPTGRKRAPFARAILGDPDAAVIDRHMLSAAGDAAWRWVTPRRARIASAALAKLARQTGDTIAQTQAILWLVEKRWKDSTS